MTTEVKKQFAITIICDEQDADIISGALHECYMKLKGKEGFSGTVAKTLREARNAFAGAIGRFYMGEDA